MSWTSSIRNAKLKGWTCVTVNAKMNAERQSFYPLGAITLDALPSQFISDPDEARAFDTLLLVHDTYMSSACYGYKAFMRDGQDMRLKYLLTTIDFDLVGAQGISEHVRFPLVISPDVVGCVKYTEIDRKTQQPVPEESYEEKFLRGTRGLCYRGGMAVTAGSDSTEFATTFRHEFIHLLHQCVPHLDQEMYGGTPEAVTEEVLTHLVADHFSKLVNLGKYSITGSMRSLPPRLSSERGEWDNYDMISEISYFDITGVTFDGKPLPLQEVNIDAVDMSNADRQNKYNTYYSIDRSIHDFIQASCTYQANSTSKRKLSYPTGSNKGENNYE